MREALLGLSAKFYGLLVRLCYPRWFRRRHGAAVRQLFLDRCAAELRIGGLGGLLRLWPPAIVDALKNGCSLRWRPYEQLLTTSGLAPDGDPTSPTRSPGSLDMLLQDLRFAWRVFVRTPVTSTVSLLTLAVGIAATITMFTVVNGVVLRPLPFPEADRIVHLLGDGDRGRWAISFPDFADLSAQTELFEQTAAWQGWRVTLTDTEGIPRIYSAAAVSGDFFDVLGVQPAYGRFFNADEDRPGHEPVVVIGHDLWQGRYGGRTDVLGEPLFEDGSFPIVGVASPGFIDPVARAIWGNRPSIWRSRPDTFDVASARDWLGFWGIGRLAADVALERADGQVQALGARLARDFPETNEARGFHLRTLKDLAIGEARATTLLLLGAVGLLLLIACANVATLLLSRGAVRRQEIAVRVALGATRGLIVRQLLVESVAVATVATALGLGSAYLVLPALIDLAGNWLPRVETIGVDATVVGFSALAAVVTAAVFGTAPALQLSARGTSLRGPTGRGLAGRRAVGAREAFVIGQTALAVILLIGAGLLAKSLWRLDSVDLGVETRSVLAARMVFGGDRYPTLNDRVLGIERVAARLAELAGVDDVAMISNRPLSGTFDSTPVTRDDMPPPDPGAEVRPLVRAVDARYFALMGMPITRGRGFTSADRDPAAMVAVIDEEAARRLFGDEDLLGKRVTVRGHSREIVGVVGNVRNFGPAGDLLPVLYQPIAQTQQSWILANMTFMLRSHRAPEDLGEVVRRAVNEVDPSLAVASVVAMDAAVANALAAPRFRALLVTSFAGIATLLAAVGLAGVIAHAVASQRREIAVRIALGAPRRKLLANVIGRAARLTTWGLAAGGIAAWAMARIMASFLFEVTPTDAMVFTAVPALLAMVGLLAAATPAVRATRVEPAIVLRGD